MDDVLLARIAVGGVCSSIFLNRSSLMPTFSVAASIATSTSNSSHFGRASMCSEHAAALFFGHPPLLDGAREVALDRREAAVDEALFGVVQEHFVAGLRGDLGDAGSHLAGSDHENPHRYPTFTSTASPWPPPLQIAAMPSPPPRRRN